MVLADMYAMKVLSIVGARPQFVKLAPLHKEISRRHQHYILHTGQHYDPQMNDSFFSILDIPAPDCNLGVGSGPHGEQTGRMMMEMEGILQDTDPDVVYLYGDTNSTVAGALVAAKLGMPIAHIEAGPRLYDRHNPEEINRVVTDHLSQLLFCPSEVSRLNLQREGILEGVHVTGDLMVQILHQVQGRLSTEPLSRFSLQEGGYVLCTLHRAENVDHPGKLREILSALAEIPYDVVLPMHPRTRKTISQFGLSGILEGAENVKVSEPLDYLSFLSLNKHAHVVLTDSGGVQKEAYVFNTPCLTVFHNTGWVETVDEGWNHLLPADRGAIVSAMREVRRPDSYLASYGGSDVAAKMLHITEEYLTKV
jgi:UDP-N-acetylglucosamine 2-epimerase